MKNTLKSLIIMALALIMVFGSIPAFAAEIGDTVLWDEGFTEETFYDEYRYGGKLTEGENHISAYMNDEYAYSRFYEFDVEKTGYYTCDSLAHFGEFDSDGILHNADFPFSYYYNNGYNLAVYLEEGTVIVGVIFEEYDSANLEIKYIDDEIVDIIYDETLIENKIYDSDIELYDGYFEFYDQDYTVLFSNGEKIEVDGDHLLFTMKDEPVNGKNTVYATFADYEEKAEATFYYMDYFVESVELSNVDYYLDAYEYYNGRFGFIDYADEEITVNYTDGTSETFVYGYNEENGQKREITLFGEEYFISIWHSETGLYLNVTMSGITFAEYDCNVVKADRFSNRNYLEENLNADFEIFVGCMEFYWSNMWNPEHIEYFLVNANLFFDNFTRLADMATEIVTYIRFVYL